MTPVDLLSRTTRVGECMVWLGAVQSRGYGSVGIGNGKSALAHRVSYELHFGAIPDDLTVDHVWARGCRHKTCVNPAHLELTTRAENVRRVTERQTHCKRGHELAGENLLLKKRGPGRSAVRNCRTCRDTQKTTRALRAAGIEAVA